MDVKLLQGEHEVNGRWTDDDDHEYRIDQRVDRRADAADRPLGAGLDGQRPCPDRLPVEEPPQVVGQLSGGGVTAGRCLLQAPQADRLQVRGDGTDQPPGRDGAAGPEAESVTDLGPTLGADLEPVPGADPGRG